MTNEVWNIYYQHWGRESNRIRKENNRKKCAERLMCIINEWVDSPPLNCKKYVKHFFPIHRPYFPSYQIFLLKILIEKLNPTQTPSIDFCKKEKIYRAMNDLLLQNLSNEKGYLNYKKYPHTVEFLTFQLRFRDTKKVIKNVDSIVAFF
jgi:hypothetical protein